MLLSVRRSKKSLFFPMLIVVISCVLTEDIVRLLLASQLGHDQPRRSSTSPEFLPRMILTERPIINQSMNILKKKHPQGLINSSKT